MPFEKKDLGTVPLGKYRGKKWSEVPEGHLKYVIDNPYLDKPFKRMAREELSQRNVCEGQYGLFENVR